MGVNASSSMNRLQRLHITRYSSSKAMSSDFDNVLSQYRQTQLHKEPRQIFTFHPNQNSWVASSPCPTGAGLHLSTEFKIATWNIDFMRPHHAQRYKTALDHLQKVALPESNTDLDQDIDNSNNPIPTIILIQEIECEFFSAITDHPFVKENYILTDVSSDTWVNKFSAYGTMTMIPKSMAKYVAGVFRTRFLGSTMERDALYVDILLQSPSKVESESSPQELDQDDKRYLRIANVHLESLRGKADIERLIQLASIVPFLEEECIHAGILAGDMNPIGPHDAAAPTRLGFVDAWSTSYRQKKEAEGVSDVKEEEIDRDAEGHTWGYQPRTRFSPTRMDKILMKGKVDIVDIERVGVDVKVGGLGTAAKPVWVSDHYGLLGRFRLGREDKSR